MYITVKIILSHFYFIKTIPVYRVLLTWLGNVKCLFSVFIPLLLSNNLLHPMIL